MSKRNIFEFANKKVEIKKNSDEKDSCCEDSDSTNEYSEYLDTIMSNGLLGFKIDNQNKAPTSLPINHNVQPISNGLPSFKLDYRIKTQDDQCENSNFQGLLALNQRVDRLENQVNRVGFQCYDNNAEIIVGKDSTHIQENNIFFSSATGGNILNVNSIISSPDNEGVLIDNLVVSGTSRFNLVFVDDLFCH